MCYMEGKRKAELPVGVRELRQNLSVYLARLAEGIVYRVTDRGVPVALLIPLPEPATAIERLVSAGRAVPAKRNLAALGKPVIRAKASVSVALAEIRDDRL
jgi:prevent-host-death family protein